MSRFSIYPRKDSPYLYAELKNPITGEYLTQKSTRQTDRAKAEEVVRDWEKNGIPTGRNGERKNIEDALNIDTILYYIRKTECTKEDAQRIAEAMKTKGLVESITLKRDGTGEQPCLWAFH